MSEESKSNLTNPDIWIRLLYMVVFVLFLAVARLVIAAIAFIQFLLVLLTDHDNRNLRNLGQSIAKWYLQALLFLTFNTEVKPFPFSDWPEVDPVDEPESAGSASADAGLGTDSSGQESSESAANQDVPTLSETAMEPEREHGASTDGSDADTGGGETRKD